MKLSVASSYAVTALVYFAQEKPEAVSAARDVASAAGISRPSLLNVLTPLVDAGILRSHTGPDGGYSLARVPKDVTLLEIVEAVDGPPRALVEPVGNGEGMALDKRLQVVCDGVVAVVRERLAKVTLAELARGK